MNLYLRRSRRVKDLETSNRHLVARRSHLDRKSTRLNSSHGYISYAVFCLKKKTKHRLGRSPARSGVCADAARRVEGERGRRRWRLVASARSSRRNAGQRRARCVWKTVAPAYTP